MRPEAVQRWESRAAAATIGSPAAAGAPVWRAAVPSSTATPARLASTLLRWLGRLAVGVTGILVALSVLLAAAPHFLPVETFSVVSGSMRPTIPVGAVVVGTPVRATDIRLGDIITFQPPGRPDRLVTHRVRQVSQTAAGPVFVTQGDANPAPDAWQLQGSSSTPVYRYVFSVPYAGYAILLSQVVWVRLAVAAAGVAGFGLLWWRSGAAPSA
jgi:signal peptidase I